MSGCLFLGKMKERYGVRRRVGKWENEQKVGEGSCKYNMYAGSVWGFPIRYVRVRANVTALGVTHNTNKRKKGRTDAKEALACTECSKM